MRAACAWVRPQAVHIFAAAFMVVTLIIHAGGLAVVVAGVWAFDGAVRLLYMVGLANPKEVEVVTLPGDVVRISWRKDGFEYGAAQYVYVNIPAVNWAEFHPFSFSSAPCAPDGMVHIHVRVLGNWTRALHTFASKVRTHLSAHLSAPCMFHSITHQRLPCHALRQCQVWALHPLFYCTCLPDPLGHLAWRLGTDGTKQAGWLPGCLQDITPGVPKRVRAFIEGPYGTPAVNLLGDRWDTRGLTHGWACWK